MNTPDSASAPRAKAASTSWVWRWLRRLLIGVAGLVTLIALVVAIEDWRGWRAWQQFKTEWEAKGEHFDLAHFLPPPVPAEENFAMTPLLAPLLDYRYEGEGPHRVAVWRDTNAVARVNAINVFATSTTRREAPQLGSRRMEKLTDLGVWQTFFRDNTNFIAPPQPGEPARDVLFGLEKFDPALDELRAASRRAHAAFHLHAAEGPELLLPYLAALKGLCLTTRLHSMARLGGGQTDLALQDVQLGLHLAGSVRNDPLLISHLVRIACLAIATDSIWEGLAKHQWTEPQLAELEKTLAGIDLFAEYAYVMRGERAFSNDYFDRFRRGDNSLAAVAGLGDAQPLGSPSTFHVIPNGWFYQNQLCICRLHQDVTLKATDSVRHRIYPQSAANVDELPEPLRHTTPYNIFARMLFPAFAKCAWKTALQQTVLDQTRVACALERHRLATGKLPESLNGLVPRFLDRVLNDVVDGQPLRYRRTADDQFVLYSVGRDGIDDGGKIVWNKTHTTRNTDEGDWVW